MDISKAISAIREGRGIKQVEIAAMLGIEQSNYSRLEKRGNKLAVDQLQAIADALGVTVLDILTWGEVKPEPSGDDTIKEIQQLKKYVAELEGKLYDINFKISHTKMLINHRLSTIFYDVAAELKLGTIKFKDENRRIISVPYADLNPQSMPDDFDFEMSEDEQQQAYRLMFTRQDYSVEATFLVSTGFIEDGQMIQSFRKYAPEQSLNRRGISPTQLAYLKKTDDPIDKPLREVSSELGYKEIFGTNKG